MSTEQTTIETRSGLRLWYYSGKGSEGVVKTRSFRQVAMRTFVLNNWNSYSEIALRKLPRSQSLTNLLRLFRSDACRSRSLLRSANTKGPIEPCQYPTMPSHGFGGVSHTWNNRGTVHGTLSLEYPETWKRSPLLGSISSCDIELF